MLLQNGLGGGGGGGGGGTMRWCRVEPTKDSVSRVRAVSEREEREKMQTVWVCGVALPGRRILHAEAIMLSACTYGSAVYRLLLTSALL